MLIHNHTRNLFETQPISKESHLALRKLIDNVLRNTRALKGLGQPVDQWDTLLIYLISQKLDNNTRKEWETFNKDDSPKFHDFLNFLKNKCQILETIYTKNQNVVENSIEPRSSRTPRNILSHLNATDPGNPSFNQFLLLLQRKNPFCIQMPKVASITNKRSILRAKKVRHLHKLFKKRTQSRRLHRKKL